MIVASQALDVDLLSNSDLIEKQEDLTVQTAVWFYKINKIDDTAKQGDFAATTQIINGKLKCNGGLAAASTTHWNFFYLCKYSSLHVSYSGNIRKLIRYFSLLEKIDQVINRNKVYKR